jgi:hypothetical protein
MYRSNRELWFSFIVIVILTVLYLFMVVTLREIPAASDFFGHMLGVLGFILMLMTETLYSLRKRSRSARWGRMADWLQFHIFTGLVGPYMVLLHTSWKFNGLAGLVMLMTLIIVASGFIGRYIYTAIPRTADGIEIEAVELQRQIAVMETELKRLEATQSAQITRAQRKHLKTLQRQRRALVRQVASLAQARRLMALWHAIHIPIGVALFTAAFVHMGAALYYATLLR